jgi:isopentenyl-diphosphate delta-isomerase
MEHIILVDSNDKEIGIAEKLACHIGTPKLHRAFSVFVFNKRGQMLIQKRSNLKKTWPGFWTNTCCSHPRPGEDTLAAAQRRLKEEIGIAIDLTFLFKFEYSAMYDKEWGENELDWVFAGFCERDARPDPAEVEEIKWINADNLSKDVRKNQQNYTPWFKMALPKVVKWYKENQ